ncbi:MAG: SPOR domain-containing protein [Candidatus Cloacimonetes bacterium]|nr:SPOR domain-containing protein [Candidatus Cloacimonadota bacterium]
MKRTISLLLIILFAVLLPTAEDELLYQQAMDRLDGELLRQDLTLLINRYPDSYFTQLAWLELGKMELLARNYSAAESNLLMISDSHITDKQYWLAKSYFNQENYQAAIVSSQNYIFLSQDKDKIESSYFLIIESYIQQKMFVRALNNLEYLRNSEYIRNQIPLLHYKAGYCHEMLNNIQQAFNTYRKLMLEFPYHEYSYLAEDRIYELMKNNALDPLSTELPLPVSDDNKTEPAERKIYLQVGAFSNRENADKQGVTVKKILQNNYIIFSKQANGKTLFVVAMGPYTDKLKLEKDKLILENNNINSFEIQRYE